MSSNWNRPELVAPGPRKPILDLVLRSLDFRATDPRDRIFALISFGEETHQVTELPSSIKPDYSRTTAQVFCDFTLWWIERHRSLGILSAVHTLQRRTWVDLSGDHSTYGDIGSPDFSEQPTWTPWYNGHSTWRYGTLALSETQSYQACVDKYIDLGLLEDSKTSIRSTRFGRLIPAFRGVQIGTITSIEHYILSHLLVSQPSDMDKAFMAVFDPTGDLGIWRTARPALGTVDLNSTDVKGALYSYLMNHARDKEYPRDHLPCIGKCLFRTHDGKRGLCPSPARVGDLVVILYGGQVPYLLRAVDGGGLFAFVGECYLDGFMSGEAFTNGGEIFQESTFDFA